MDAFQGERTVGPCKGNKEYEDDVNTSLSIGYEWRIISDADNMKLTHNWYDRGDYGYENNRIVDRIH